MGVRGVDVVEKLGRRGGLIDGVDRSVLAG